jgi:hypothetical protein
VGRFLSVDPLSKKYAQLTPYQFASNTPIAMIDIDGMEGGDYMMWAMVKTNESLRKNGYTNAQVTQFNNEMVHGLRESNKTAGKVGAIEVAMVIDAFLTKGWLTRTLLGTQVFGAFPHNPSSTPEGRRLQNQNSKEALADAFLTWGSGKVMGAVFQSTIAAYEGNQIIKKALKDGVKIIVAKTPDDLAYLKSMDSKALYMGGEGKSGSILLTQDAKRSHILEEAIHHQQRMTYGDKYFYSHQAKLEVG